MPSNMNKRTFRTTMVAGVLILGAALGGCTQDQSTQALVADAKQFMQRGDSKAALIQLKNAAEKSPKDAEIRLLLGKLYNETGAPESAEKEIRKAISLGMPSARAVPPLGRSLLARGMARKALEESEAESANGAADVLAMRGTAYLALNDAALARTAFEQALKAQPDNAGALLGLARQALLAQDVEAATRYVDQAIAKNPRDITALLFKAEMLRAQNRVAPALAAYDAVLQVDSANATAYLMKAHIHINEREFDAAKAGIAAARKAAPNNLQVWYTQARLSDSQQQYPAALEALQQVLRAAPEHLPSLLLAGSVQFQLGSLEQSEQSLRKYLASAPDNLYARKLLATTLLKARQPEAAVATLAPALKTESDNAQLYALAGEAAMQTKDYAKASEYFGKASRLAPESAAGHMSVGLSHLVQGRLDDGVTALESAVELDKKSVQAGVLLAMAHARAKAFDKALQVLATLEKEQPANPLLNNLKGDILLASGDKARARASYTAALKLEPAFVPAVINLSRLDLAENKPDAAKQQLEALLARDKKSYAAMTALATLAAQQGRRDEATAWLERSYNENPTLPEPAALLARHYLGKGEHVKALRIATSLKVANPRSPEALALLGDVQFGSGDKNGALESYSQLVAAQPRSPSAQFQLARVYMAMGNDTAVAAALKAALALQPDFLEAEVAQAMLELRRGNAAQALLIAQRIQKQAPKVPLGFVLEGEALMHQKKGGPAAKAYEQAQLRNKDDATLMIKIYEAQYLAGQGKEGEARLLQWVKEHPADVRARTFLGALAQARHQNKDAIQWFQAVLQHQPENVDVMNNLAWAYFEEKDPQARPMAERAQQLAPANPAVLDTLGWILVEQGDSARGLPLLRKASELAPDSHGLRYHLAAALAKSGDKAGARKELDRLLLTGKAFAQEGEARALLQQL